MIKKVERDDKSKLQAIVDIVEMKKKMEEERDKCDRQEQAEMMKRYSEQKKVKSRSDHGDDVMEDGESRKRKRDVETGNHMDIDVLM
ncbi:unnamed protein product [Aureobasidium uvarum]|uniref:Uncharacterized protein n=1 Tax=Aureobasidium uvarum TaxID=2773716 RepID=A0A9N8KI68_9PEZI|nr:unnamed protein product [Aureobasidium uvarum]